MTEAPAIEPKCNEQPAIRSLPELLAPAGDWECAKAAVENGADAIYFGLDKFNARMRAHNFTEADLPKLMAFLHRRGVKGYVTFNTLVFENEIADAQNYLRAIIAAGVDAAIVQDVGICRLIRELSPDFPIHSSTQMTVTSAAGVEFCRELGCNLVVLARECSIKEIEKIQQGVNDELRMTNGGESDTGSPFDIRHSSFPLEVFVHGALCVAYSGQCLTSESLGGRSANRGECAQACRMPYELISDGKQVPLGDRKYLLSPQDLAGLEILPELVRVGVVSLKIEGRLKSPEYVASITRVYRGALDKLGSSRREEALTLIPKKNEPPHVGCYEDKYEMEMSFSRGLFTGWFGGTDNQKLVHARFGKKRGVFLGEVEKILRDGVAVNLVAPLKLGDGLVFDAGHPEAKEEGGRVYEIRNPKAEGRSAEIHFGYGDIDFSRVHVGDKIWKTDDPELDKRLRQTFAGDAPRFQRPIEMEVHGLAGKPLTVIVRDESGNVVKVESTMPLAKAEKLPLSEEKLRDQLGRLGGTPFSLGTLKNFLSGEVLLPVSELNRLRREAVAELDRLRSVPKRWQLVAVEGGEEGSGCPAQIPSPQPSAERRPRNRLDGEREPSTVSRCAPVDVNPRQVEKPGGEDVSRVLTNTATNLIVLVRNLAQLEVALKCGVTTMYCEFEDPKKYREAVTLFHTAYGCQTGTGNQRPEIFVAPPRIFKPGDEWILKQVRSSNADGYLVRNYDHLKFFADTRRVGDFSLNVANRMTADYFKNKFGLERVTASYDLNAMQLDALLQAAPPEWFEITIHQHMPMFHMEHCVFCAFLSSGKDYHDCGRPCDHHDVRLRDRVGAEHPLKADAGCRNTVFNSQAQTGAEFVEHLLALGVRHFRMEFLNETPEEVARTIAKYRQLLRGEISGAQLWRELKLFNQLGVTRGQMGK
jgi:putative protease